MQSLSFVLLKKTTGVYARMPETNSTEGLWLNDDFRNMVFDLIFAPLPLEVPDTDLVLQNIQYAQDKMLSQSKDPALVQQNLFFSNKPEELFKQKSLVIEALSV